MDVGCGRSRTDRARSARASTVAPVLIPTTTAVARGVSRVSTWAGVLLVAYAGYALFGTGVATGREQRRLVAGFHAEVASAQATAAGTSSPPMMDSSPPPPPEGSAVAIVKIPKLALERAIVEGTSFGDLAKGPGHYVGTPLPGEAGNAGIPGIPSW